MPRTIMTFINKFVSTALRLWHTRRRTVIVSALAIVLLVGGYAAYRGLTHTTADIPEQTRHAELIAVASYAQSGMGTGTGSSVQEFVLRAESGGMVTRVLPVGSYVSASSVVAELDNDAQRAALLQTEGVLDSAKASQQKVLEGTRLEQLAIYRSSYDAARDGAVNTLLSAYSTVDSAIRDTADQMFVAPESAMPILGFTTSDSSRDTYLQNTRTTLSSILAREKKVSEALSSGDDLMTEIATAMDEVRTIRSFIDALVAALNVATPTPEHTGTQLATYRASATAARTALGGALSSLTAAQSALVSAEKSLEQAQNGAQDTDIAAAAANVKQSKGAYASALAAYEKTLIRARTGGRVTSCSAAVGDVVGIGADICRVASSGADMGGRFALPLSSVKYSPVGAYIFALDERSAIRAVPVETGLVTADTVAVYGLSGDEMIVKDVRGLREGEVVATE